jgi:hypothetical protein
MHHQSKAHSGLGATVCDMTLASASGRKTYATPALLDHGRIVDLTASGSGSRRELTCGWIPYKTRQRC